MNEKVTPHNHWFCLDCKTKEMTFAEVKDHLTSVHKIDLKTTEGTKNLLMHADGTDFYTYHWAVTINDPDSKPVNLENHILQERDEESKKYWQ